MVLICNTTLHLGVGVALAWHGCNVDRRTLSLASIVRSAPARTALSKSAKSDPEESSCWLWFRPPPW